MKARTASRAGAAGGVGSTRTSRTATATVDPAVVLRVCHALSDGTRLAILERLRGGEQCVCNLVDLLGAGQSRLSFHLRTLRDAGLVRDRREGRWVHYSLDTGTLEAIERYVASFRSLRSLRGSASAPGEGSCCPK